jgi:hypothetical protein
MATSVDFLILCDAAQVSPDSKLHLLGGAWTHHQRQVPQNPPTCPSRRRTGPPGQSVLGAATTSASRLSGRRCPGQAWTSVWARKAGAPAFPYRMKGSESGVIAVRRDLRAGGCRLR